MIGRMLRSLVFVLAAAALIAAGYRMLTPATTKPAVADKVEKDDRPDGVVLSNAKVAAAGIELATAAPAVLRENLLLNGVVQANQEALVQVTPRFPGIIKEVRKRIGDRVEKGEVLAVVESNQSLTAYELKSSLAGTVIDRQTTLGEYASEQKPAFVVADLSTIWVDLSIYRQDLKRVRLNDEVLIDPDDGRGEIKGTISYMAPIGSSETQTALARVVLPNPDGRLRPGLFVTARLVLAKRNVAVAVRTGAIQMLENKTVVFVREDDDKIEARPVETGDSDSKFVEIRAGLSAGERYVAENSFVVKAEMGKGEADHD